MCGPCEGPFPRLRFSTEAIDPHGIHNLSETVEQQFIIYLEKELQEIDVILLFCRNFKTFLLKLGLILEVDLLAEDGFIAVLVFHGFFAGLVV